LEQVFDFINNYGYLAVLIGTFIDHFGLPAYAMAAAAFAKLEQSQLNIFYISLLALAGGIISDIFYFFCAHYIPKEYFKKKINDYKIATPFEALELLLQKNTSLVLIFGRFVAGISRFIAPLAGVYRIPKIIFILYTILGNLIYFAVFIPIAYYIGGGIIAYLQSAKRLQILFGLIIIILFILFAKKIKTKFYEKLL